MVVVRGGESVKELVLKSKQHPPSPCAVFLFFFSVFVVCVFGLVSLSLSCPSSASSSAAAAPSLPPSLPPSLRSFAAFLWCCAAAVLRGDCFITTLLVWLVDCRF